MLKSKNLTFIGSVLLSLLSLFQITTSGTVPQLDTTYRAVKNQITAQAAPVFSSAYTDTTKQCIGQEPLFTCKGVGNYQIKMGIGGVFADLRIDSTKSDFSLSVAQYQSVGWNPKVEWRLADGKPFAVIVRVDVNDENATEIKKLGEKLVIKGLQGFEHIDGEVDTKKVPKSNEKAREIADQAFTGNKASADTATTGEAYTDGKTAALSDVQLKNLGKLNAAIALPTYIPAGYALKKLWIQEPEAHIIAFSMTYTNSAGKSFQLQSNNEALGDMAVKREIKGKSDYFLDSAQESPEFYTGHDANDSKTIASEWLCNPVKYQPKTTEYAQCYQLLSDNQSVSPAEAMKIMQSLRYLKR